MSPPLVLDKLTPVKLIEKLSSSGTSLISTDQLMIRATACASRRGPPAAPLRPLPEPDEATLAAIGRLHPVFLARSAGHVATLKRLAAFLPLTDLARLELFVATWESRSWATSTAETYWGTIMGGLKALDLQVSKGDIAFGKWVEARASEWIPTQASTMMLGDLLLLEAGLSAMDPMSRRLVTLIAIGWLLGQRLSDVLQLHPADITRRGPITIITVRRGKVVPSTGVYCLALPPSRWADRLWHLATITGPQRTFLASTSNSPIERALAVHHATALLKSANELLESRSVRRGGLLRLASAGLNTLQLRAFSRHTNDRMLMRYLSWGADVVAHVNEMASAVSLSLTA